MFRVSTERGAQTRRCIFCLRSDAAFTTREHPIPEGLGNKDITLDRGVVCDDCNHGRLAVLDQTFLDFAPVAMMRTFRGVQTKAGKRPRVNFGNSRLSQIGQREVVFESNSRRASQSIEGGVRFRVIGRRATDKYMAQLTRFLFKVALELVYVDHGPSVALAEGYDEARRIALGERFAGYLLLQRHTQPHFSVSATYTFRQLHSRPTVAIALDVFGVLMGTDLLVRRPVTELRTDPNAIILEFDDRRRQKAKS